VGFRAIIMGYRRGTNTQYTRQVILRVEGVPLKVVRGLAGRRVVYRDRHGNVYRGRVLKPHGARNPLLLARFERPLPGQAIGGVAEIL
jgi:large subunit ribosomal protein L35Ae